MAKATGSSPILGLAAFRLRGIYPVAAMT